MAYIFMVYIVTAYIVMTYMGENAAYGEANREAELFEMRHRRVDVRDDYQYQQEVAACIASHNYIGHNYTGHNYIGHNYTGHNYMGTSTAAERL